MPMHDQQAILSGLLGVVFLTVFAVSSARHGSWRTSWRGPALLLVLVCVGLTVAELRGLVLVGPGGDHGVRIP